MGPQSGLRLDIRGNAPESVWFEVFLERFQAKWAPVRVKKTRQNKRLEPRYDSIGTGLQVAAGNLPGAALF